ncbi:MAG: FAD-dependent oxidoreductase [Acidimicrobiales bacterium]|nr:FAD-dependent oxidoreductase [Acidimicrobiales bacterium]
MTRFDVVVVGAGPAGSAAALVAARAGKRVCLLERGPFPGSKNMYGGVVYGRILDRLIPRWWEEAPIERWVVRRGTMLASPTQSVTIDVRSTAWGQAPYNGATAHRPDFDAWLAGHAEAAGATLVCSTTAVGLLREGGRIRGVRTDRPDGDIEADVVIACDGVNSFLAKEAGLHELAEAEHHTLGVKEVLALPKEEIDRRFNLRDRDGADFEIVGCTGDVGGGGFLYTNLESVAVGVVLHLPALARSGRRPEDIIAELKAHPSVAPLVEGGELLEYSAHLIPEGGYDVMPEIVTDGMLVAGDAAGLCLAAGIWLEGVNFAIGSGAAAGETAVHALGRGDVSASGLGSYRTRLENSFVLADHRKLRRVPGLLLSERAQHRYPDLACRIAEEVFTVRNPTPKPGINHIVRTELRRSGVKMTDLVRDLWTGWRSYG